MKILIPMAGEGSRFAQAGYTFPKPLIDVNGKPMIQCVVENLSFDDAEYIFLVRWEHLDKFELDPLLDLITQGRRKIIMVDKLTEGAACTALLAQEFIDNDDDLLIANSDQVIEYSKENFDVIRKWADVNIVFTFRASHPKWSFVRTDATSGHVVEVAEKRPISNIATCGIYHYRRGADFVRCAKKMIEKNIRVNNEFYIAPVYNELLAEGQVLVPFFVHRMHGLGTPEDLEKYLGSL